ncbi:translesion DNA synthesis-associated protein ImuA [Microbulbifer sp. THAF38]|uniref:translesion DNA synthesis-associated protein ImuA n=1 Tax=Microbulbifer sp. THAF38 TaxID=2587856 RepID=UPI0020A31545|nr:translesion DNA synthesis-associated protein ImuA [Microbulbifer sp. THAF38]
MNRAKNSLQNNQLDCQTNPSIQLRHFRDREVSQAANEPQSPGAATGFASLDALLKDHGWPRGATTELLVGQANSNELSLLLPILAQLTQKGEMVILIKPPLTPCATELTQYGVQLEHLLLVHPRDKRDCLWAIEQSLQSGGCSAVLSWQGNQSMSYRELQRLQQSAEESGCLHFLFRPQSESANPSPASLRVQLKSDGQLALKLLKQLGGARGQNLYLARRARLVLRDQPLH